MKTTYIHSMKSKLRETFSYDEDTGDLTNIETGKSFLINNQGYKTIQFMGKKRRMHILVWIYHNGPTGGKLLDHKDTIRANCRIDNLRLCTNSENQRNRGKQKNNTSGYKGVFKNGNKYIARIRHNKKLYNLGTYDTPKMAHDEYVKKAKELHGEFAHFYQTRISL